MTKHVNIKKIMRKEIRQNRHADLRVKSLNCTMRDVKENEAEEISLQVSFTSLFADRGKKI